eukprot:CAMPEP_0181288846 /NCGR_PEP_ID=MMETSP1101-20121128/560_1 /TAXON_ID=46948 /ORGANISM="Rhodomonas abbreviata, Strain Caron Lab Isolate" /LENGTH=2036 /DNA_ID=CAMNT_0023393015 /DNA_START=546 /DNA_END=6656 /DNA_ORIENTATION=+
MADRESDEESSSPRNGLKASMKHMVPEDFVDHYRSLSGGRIEPFLVRNSGHREAMESHPRLMDESEGCVHFLVALTSPESQQEETVLLSRYGPDTWRWNHVAGWELLPFAAHTCGTQRVRRLIIAVGSIPQLHHLETHYSLKNLQRLELDCANAGHLPDENLQQFIFLEELVLYDSNAELAARADESDLQVDIMHQPLFEFPRWIEGLTRLKMLSCSNCERLKEIPDWIGNLSSLRSLQLTDAQRITYRRFILPSSIGKLTGLQNLLLAGQWHLPPSIVLLSGLHSLALCVTPIGGQDVGEYSENDDDCDSTDDGGEHRWGESFYAPAQNRIFSSMTNLQNLYLGKSVYAELYGHHMVKGVPDWLGGLRSLKTIDFSNCASLTGLPSEVSFGSNIVSLNLANCSRLHHLPEWFVLMTQLETLDLSGCEMHPVSFLQFRSLRYLDLRYCFVADDRIQEVGTLTLLQTLRLGPWGTSPPELGSLVNLTELHLSEFQFEILPQTLFSLDSLTVLNLSGCQSLESLPDWMCIMTNLRVLSLRSCPNLCQLPSTMSRLTALEDLDLQGCDEIDLPAWIGCLTSLQILKFGNDDDDAGNAGERYYLEDSSEEEEEEEESEGGAWSLPEEMKCLLQLRELTLQGTGLQQLPVWMGCFTNLEVLDLSGCLGLKGLPPSMGRMLRLRQMSLPPRYMARHELVPAHVEDAGCSAILQYLRDLDRGHISCKLLKMIIVGDQLAGKSSLVDCLAAGAPCLRPKEDRTVGIDVRRWSPEHVQILDPVRAKESHKSDMEIKKNTGLVVHIYDAAGQKVYRATHGIFFSPEALFVLTINAQDETAADAILMWMEVLQQHCSNPLVLLVFTHMDIIQPLSLDKCCNGRGQPDSTAWYYSSLTRLKCMEDVLQRVKLQFRSKTRDLDTVLKKKESGIRRYMDGSWFTQLRQRDMALTRFTELVEKGLDIPSRVLESSQLSDACEAIQVAKQVASLHESLGQLEKKVREKLNVFDEVQILRKKRLQMPLLVASVGVSCKDLGGFRRLREVIIAASKSKTLFPHLHRKVPVTYAMLERLAREARQRVPGTSKPKKFIWDESVPPDLRSGGPEDEHEIPSCWGYQQPRSRRAEPNERAGHWNRGYCQTTVDSVGDLDDVSRRLVAWEVAVNEHIEKCASAELRELCRKPQVLLEDLRVEAVKCGITSDEIVRAVRYLHGTGAALHFQDSAEFGSLQEFVFLQPQWIVDAIKYVIREYDGDDLNSELREIENEIMQDRTACSQLEVFKRCGQLREDLLRNYLWGLPKYGGAHPLAGERKFPDYHVEDLLDLMQSFGLLVPMKSVKHKTYMVPAMLNKDICLPDAYVKPHWYVPLAANDAPALMRRQYSVTRLPFGFLSQLQARISLRMQPNPAEHYTEGSVLSLTVGEHSNTVREVVVISLCSDSDESGIRVMAWVQPSKESAAEFTDWTLFKAITQEIEDTEELFSGLVLESIVPHVHDGEITDKLPVEQCSSQPIIQVKNVEGHLNDVEQYRLFPCTTPLLRIAGRQGDGHRVLAFFAVAKADKLNVHREAQNLTILFTESVHYSTPITHPLPMYEEFKTGLMHARRQNVIIVHMAGHGDRNHAFWLLKDVNGDEYEPIDPHVVSQDIARECVAKGGTVECVVLNGCNTEGLGKLLRQNQVKHIVCWRLEVEDQAARAFVDRFYTQLDTIAREEASRSVTGGAFRRAFEAGKCELQVWESRQDPETVRAPNAVVFLSTDGDILPDVDQHSSVSFNPLVHLTRSSAMLQSLLPSVSRRTGFILSRRTGFILCSAVVALVNEWRGKRSRLRQRIRLSCLILVLASFATRFKLRACLHKLLVLATRICSPPENPDGMFPAEEVSFGEETRSANNKKGEMEALAFEALGVSLEFKGFSIRQSIQDYRKDRLSRAKLLDRGLEEDARYPDPECPGKKLLHLSIEALTFMFKTTDFGYENFRGYGQLFGAQGVLVQWARQASQIKRNKAETYLQASLSIREKQIETMRKKFGRNACQQHIYIAGEIRECLTAIQNLGRAEG